MKTGHTEDGMKSRMLIKKYSPIFAGAIAGIFLASMSGQSFAGVETAIGSDVSSNELRALTIESWDRDYTGGGYGWEVETDNDTTVPGAPYQPLHSNDKAEREVKMIPGTPRDIRENMNIPKDASGKPAFTPYILGVKYVFSFPGFNEVTIRPPRHRADRPNEVIDHYMVERPRPYLNETALQSHSGVASCFTNTALSSFQGSARHQAIDCVYGIEMPGMVKQLSVWVCGRGNEYDLEGWIEDWTGATHILKFGSVDFVGWRPLSTRVPISIPQEVNAYPQIKTLVFKQFKLRSRADTSLETVYIFFDELRILTDIFEVHFDGAQIDFEQADCERKNHLLELIRENARNPSAFSELSDCSAAPGHSARIPEIDVPNKTGDNKAQQPTQPQPARTNP